MAEQPKVTFTPVGRPPSAKSIPIDTDENQDWLRDMRKSQKGKADGARNSDGARQPSTPAPHP